MARLDEYVRELRPTIALAVPIMLGQVSQTLMSVTDSVMIGHAGTVPLAASAFASNVFLIFFVLGVGLTVPVSIFVSRAAGAARPEEAADYLRHGTVIALAFGGLEALVMLGLSLGLSHFGQPPEVVAVVVPFFVLTAVSIVPALVYLALRQFAEAMGHPWAPTLLILGGVALNAGLNWIFIYGHLGSPALGLTGAGISTLISHTLATIAIFVWLQRDARMRSAWPQSWRGAYSLARFREMMHVGLPAAGMLFFETTAFSFSTIMVGWLGTVSLAAHQIALTCATFSFMFPLGLSIATGMRVSRAVGAGERSRLRPIAFTSLGIAGALMVTFAVAFAFGGRALALRFVRDEAVVALASQLLVIAAIFQMFDGWQATAVSALRGITDVRIPAAITFAAYWLIALPIGYALGIRGPLGAIGMWIGIASGLGCAAVLLTTRFALLTRPAQRGPDDRDDNV